MNVVQLTESLFDRRRLPDELLNRALLRAMGVPLPAAATPADGADPRAELTDARMDAAVRARRGRGRQDENLYFVFAA